MMNYLVKLRHAISESRSCLCIGLDPHLDLFPKKLTEKIPDQHRRVIYFLKAVIEVTHPYCAAYKPNLAFFEALGDKGLEVFHTIIENIPDDKIIIADAKRGDIGPTARHYRQAFFDVYNVDAVTLNPLMGFETLSPWLDYPGKGIYTLTLTSNPGASDFLEKPFDGYDTMAEYITAGLRDLQDKSETALGMVVGATKPNDLDPVLKQFASAPLLIPGIGRQGGSIDELQSVLADHTGIPLVSSSRSVLFAGEDRDDWEQAVENKAGQYREQLMPITLHHV